MENKIEITQNKPSAEALFRYLVVSMILAREQQGETRPVAIDAIAAEGHPVTDGRTRKVSSRTLYRWMNAFERCGFKGLLPSVREPKTESLVIPLALLDFFKQQKELDPKTSIPELIRRAKELHLIDDTTEVDRTTVWRWLKRMGANTTRSATHRTYRDKRRFAYPHRMDMVLCDGKHFRAGASRLRRVAIFFLDDATRLGLQVVVGTSETAELFLRGLFESISRYGAMSALYVDNGSGFTAHDSIAVLQQLNVLFIRGEAGYPQGRGKIERFNQTALTHCLRNLDSNPGVNPSCSSVELRLRHFLFHQYNHTPHEGLDRQTPWDRFHKDSRPLRFRENIEELKQAFIVHHRRRVSGDNVVSFNGVKFEMPCGYEGGYVTLRHQILDRSLSFMHQGKSITLNPPDLHANALDKRAKPKPGEKTQSSLPLPESAAQIAFNRDMQPIVDTDGGFPVPTEPKLNKGDAS